MGTHPLVIAHRGASAHAPDNSAEAILLAAAQGADGVEIDVRATRDGVLVLSHDAVLPGLGPLVERSLEDIAASGVELVTLDRLPELASGMLINLEIKNHPRDPDFDAGNVVARRVAGWVTDHGLVERVLVSSFNPSTVAAVLDENPSIVVGRLLEHSWGLGAEMHRAAGAGVSWLLPRHSSFFVRGGRVVARAHAAGLRIGTWTVDRRRELRRLARHGIDAVITNDPSAALDVYR